MRWRYNTYTILATTPGLPIKAKTAAREQAGSIVTGPYLPHSHDMLSTTFAARLHNEKIHRSGYILYFNIIGANLTTWRITKLWKTTCKKQEVPP